MIATTINEEWKDVIGYEGLYQVSNKGNLRSFHKGKCKLLSLCVGKHGYVVALLHNKNGRKHVRVHRLVAQAFIPNPNNLPYINHKNEIKTDNCVENLEWCTAEYNVNYGTSAQRISEKQSVAVLQYDLDGSLVCRYNGLSEAERINGYKHCSISEVCTGKKLSYMGFIWLHEGDEHLLPERLAACLQSKNFYRVGQFDEEGNLIATFLSVGKAVKTTGVPRNHIDQQIKNNHKPKNSKYIWRIV